MVIDLIKITRAVAWFGILEDILRMEHAYFVL